MLKGSDEQEPDVLRTHRRSVRFLVHSIWLGGLVLPSLIGLCARYVLEARGVPVVSIDRGIELIVPITLFTEVPFIILAFIVSRVLSSATRREPRFLPGWMFVSGGAFLGLAAVIGYELYELLLHNGPGGFAEAVGMMLALWMFTLPMLLVFGAFGVIAGGLAATVLWLGASAFFTRQN